MPFCDLPPENRLFNLEENYQGNPPVLLLHGLGDTSRSWLLQIPELTRLGYWVLALDAPGFSQSSYPRQSLKISQIAGLVARFLDTLYTGPVFAVGISMGGTIAAQLRWISHTWSKNWS